MKTPQVQTETTIQEEQQQQQNLDKSPPHPRWRYSKASDNQPSRENIMELWI